MNCKSDSATQYVIEVLEGALGAANEISRPYPNRDGDGKRIYIKFVVLNQMRDDWQQKQK